MKSSKHLSGPAAGGLAAFAFGVKYYEHGKTINKKDENLVLFNIVNMIY